MGTGKRLLGLKYWDELKMPEWSPDISDLLLGEIETYVKPAHEMVSSWEEVPTEIREIFDKLGIPEAEKEGLAGVGAQYDSEVIYHNLKNKWKDRGWFIYRLTRR